MSKNSIKPLELVVSAIHCLRESRGSSPQDILRYLEKKYNVGKEVLKPHIQNGLKRGVSFGLITRESGLYRLNDMLSGPADIPSPHARKSPTKTNKSSGKSHKSEKKKSPKKRLPRKKRRVVFKTSMGSQKIKKKNKKHVKTKKKKINNKQPVKRRQNENKQQRQKRRHKCTRKYKLLDGTKKHENQKIKSDDSDKHTKAQEPIINNADNPNAKS